MSGDEVLVSTDGRVGTITLNRPKALNALNDAVMHATVAAAEAFDADPAIGAIMITGSERAFAAGADITEMREKSFQDVYLGDQFATWDRFTAVRTPVVAAVSGYALGGGCELVMMCDVVIASDTAVFGQPEIKIGVIPGMGGTQRLVRAVGKAKAMELVLTGRFMGAEEAERAGLVSRVVPDGRYLEEALEVAHKIAAMSLPVALAAKEAVDHAFESMLGAGVQFERRTFQAGFALDDQTEGMTAFVEKRDPRFTHR